ncbi:MAG TPA: F0F1 ATP synthase subunit B [Fervidobacterium sp.]|jgi:F-type H+-transporting ATPase subunit b|nr:F0F1 ATP synthase subunit B [Fervidobacterium sp.]NLH36622.1 F0F1 ATP synthase subunit B [Thermotogaceae bacterium]HOA16934.1 F0F1 ATP synthase subunit B [Fervidobacterium sp.]HOH53324.1 F0F1 ATP synthase subunit B [Fervidobacterium sp.]HON03865.1 F0F1 ATP synthase subunit B [Fervidobacterium sp.]
MDFFQINLTAVVQLLSFLFLLWVLNKLLYKPFLSMMDKRKEKVEGDLLEAENARKRAEELQKEAENSLKEARARADQILSAANVQAEKVVEEAKERAEKEAERVLANAKIEIERQTQEALSQVQTVATELAISLVIKVLKGTLDEKAKREYLINVLKEYEKQ